MLVNITSRQNKTYPTTRIIPIIFLKLKTTSYSVHYYLNYSRNYDYYSHKFVVKAISYSLHYYLNYLSNYYYYYSMNNYYNYRY